MSATTEADRDKIDRLFAVLERLEVWNALTWDELDIWTELAYFLCPDRLNASSTSNDEIFSAFEEHLNQTWVDQELRASVLLLYSISVQCTVGISSRRGKLPSDDSLGDAIDLRAFQFICSKIISIHKFHECYAAVELVDLFVKRFIMYCPDRLQEMFNICEEELAVIEDHEQGYIKSSEPLDRYPLHFKVLLNLIQRLYSGQSELLVRLSKQFFIPDFEHLCHFIRSGIAISSPALYVDYVDMLESLCKSQDCASFLFRHFNSNHEILYDWAGLFGSLRRYIEVFRQRLPMNHDNYKDILDAPQMMRRQDLLASIGWIRLASSISKHDSRARRYFVFGNHFNSIDTLVSVVTSFMPVLLKGEVYKFLAALAVDENSVVQIWNVLIRDSICVFGEQPGKLVGIQNEFQEVECVNRTYDSAHGFLHLARSLFSRHYLPDSRIVAPYVFFVTKSIICQCDSRSYESLQQLWDMLNVSFDALFRFIQCFEISAASVSQKTPQLFVLTQLFSDSDLNQAIIRILTVCSNQLEGLFEALGWTEFSDNYPIVLARNDATKSALRLLSYAINVHATLRASLRTAVKSPSVFVAPLENILLTPLSPLSSRNYVQLLSTFLSEQDIMLPHTLYVVRILRKLACKPASDVHDALLRSFQTDASLFKWVFAKLIATKTTDEIEEKSLDKEKTRKSMAIEVSEKDVVPFDLDGVRPLRLRGEIARELLELFGEIMDVAPVQLNLTYLLFGYNLDEFHLNRSIEFDADNQELNCMQSLLDIIHEICTGTEPDDTPYSALFDPAIRLMEKLCDANSLSSEPTRRFLRNYHSQIYKCMTEVPA